MIDRGKLTLVHSTARPLPLCATPLVRSPIAPYRPGEPNRCPGCGGRSWHVGRTNAECARCEAILPIATDGSHP